MKGEPDLFAMLEFLDEGVRAEVLEEIRQKALRFAKGIDKILPGDQYPDGMISALNRLLSGEPYTDEAAALADYRLVIETCENAIEAGHTRAMQAKPTGHAVKERSGEDRNKARAMAQKLSWAAGERYSDPVEANVAITDLDDAKFLAQYLRDVGFESTVIDGEKKRIHVSRKAFDNDDAPLQGINVKAADTMGIAMSATVTTQIGSAAPSSAVAPKAAGGIRRTTGESTRSTKLR